LLDAGETVLASKGYHATRVDDVVKVAHTSHGTFYLYFANKEDLFRALAVEVAEEMRELAAALEPLRAGATGRARLQRWIRRFVDVYRKHGAVIRAWTEAEIGGSEFGRLGTDLLTQFTGVVVARISEVAPPDLDPTILYIDPETSLVVKQTYVTGGRGTPLVEELFTDYRPVDGVQVAFGTTVRVRGESVLERRVTAFAINAPVSPALFKRPPS
jgi:AcrR family transcriptional regulator